MSEESLSTDRWREARHNARQVVVDRVTWRVYELPADTFDRRTSPSLVFESEGLMRRVRNYPAAWRTLSDAELFALSSAI